MASAGLKIDPKKSITSEPEVQPVTEDLDENAVAALAYQLWLKRGSPIGIDQEVGFKPNENFKTAGQSQRQHRLNDGGWRTMQTRQAQTELTAFTLKLDKVTIPAKAVLHDFRLGPGHEGLAPHNPDVVSFHYDGQVYFNISREIVGKTVIVMSTGSAKTGPEVASSGSGRPARREILYR